MKNKTKSQVFRILIIIAVLIGVLSIIGVVAYNHYNNYFKASPAVKQAEKHLAEVKEEKPINIMVVGTDERGNERARTDTIMIFSIDNQKKTVKLLSIPRDTYVEIPGRGMDKINHAHAFGGIPLSIDTVQKFIDQPIHYFIRTNFNSFKEIVDTLGGVTINVDKDMDGIKKGIQRLNGANALVYVRSRHTDAEADIARIRRQQTFVKAVANEVLQSKTVTKLPDLLPQLRNAVETNMTLTEMICIGNEVKSDGFNNIETKSIPGTSVMINGVSYWKPELVQAKEIVKEVFEINK